MSLFYELFFYDNKNIFVLCMKLNINSHMHIQLVRQLHIFTNFVFNNKIVAYLFGAKRDHTPLKVHYIQANATRTCIQ